MATVQRNRKVNGHSHDLVSPIDTRCPYCGQSIAASVLRTIKERIEAAEGVRLGEIEKALAARFAQDKLAIEAQAKAVIDAVRKTAAQQAKVAKASLDAAIKERLATQREALEKKLTAAVADERAKAYQERMALDARLADLQRRVQKRTPNELGDGAELDLHAALVGAFGDQDSVSRVGRAVKGPDILIEVFSHETSIGKIIIDSKNYARSRWSNRFIDKIKCDQVAESADYAILSSTAFPKGEEQLTVRDGVIVAHPQRVVAIVQILRRQLIQNHALQLNTMEKNSAADRLFAYIVSTDASDLFERLEKSTNSLIEIDVGEVTSHQSTWRKRGEVLRQLQRVYEEMTTAIDGLVSGASVEDVAA